MFHLESFWYRPNEADEAIKDEHRYGDSILVWIQAEERDEENRTAVLRKMVKNIRWLAQKVGTKTVILHSFAHLGPSKADPKVADEIIEEVAERLRAREFEVHIVPFGIFHEFAMHVRGPSIAKVYKAF
ncbi:MAG: threonyl-tRNA synthetase editing domain-containing protein [Candidatus Thorarchaeota archaeon]|nr:threonyl-tRNA synthetase editing domain-containing protein [Candidatus Thorarchaeota archaeon]